MTARLSMQEVRTRLQAFSKTFRKSTNEQQQAPLFWASFYACFGISPAESTVFEQQVRKLDGRLGRIDSFIPGLLIVEHKSKGRDLKLAYEQAQEYFIALKPEERPKYIITSDFARIVLHDLGAKATHETTIEDLPKHASWFRFLTEGKQREIVEETPINREAAYAVSKLHEALIRINFKGRDLEIFLTRLLFCLFADDTGIFDENGQFGRFIESTREDGSDVGVRLYELFDVLNLVQADRMSTLDDALKQFPYINGSLFGERTRIPVFNSELRRILAACSALDWSGISPAIFGAMFQGVLEEHSQNEKRQATRRELGAHYTSERNILRVISPLFLNDLRNELQSARAKRSKKLLKDLYERLPKLRFLDPACGCGNFLVIAYRELRRLEFEIIEELFDFAQGRGLLDVSTLCRVQLDQFYGIEIDDAAAHIARVALYITDHQLNVEAATKFGSTRASVPLTHKPNIVCANALGIDWNDVLPASSCNYIISNPPFVGAKFLSDTQRADMKLVAGKVKNFGVLDFVCAWYFKAAEYAKQTSIEIAFVSTSSIAQGEQPAPLWNSLYPQGIHINFAHRTFKWSNEGKGVAAVHCIVLGFSHVDKSPKTIFDYSGNISGEPRAVSAKQINSYLADAPLIALENRQRPICDVPRIGIGNKPIDGGNYLFTDEEMLAFLAIEPNSRPYFRRWIGSTEFINGGIRWCLMARDIPPHDLRAMPHVMRRIAAVRDFRLASKSPPTKKLAAVPTRFHVENFPTSTFLVVPKVSSEQRRYHPIGFMSPDVVVSDLVFVVNNATLYHFGVLASQMHMAWLRVVCGRLKSDFRYSAGIVYNNFPWPSADDTKINRIKATAQKILDARSQFSEATLGDLYDPLSTPAVLAVAHIENDKAVDQAYGYKGQDDDWSRASFLFGLLSGQLQAELLLAKPSPKRRVARTTGGG